jgi:predicted nucleic acid-binding protein
MPVVVDASVAIKWILIEELHVQARRLVEDEDEEIHAPDLLFAETTNIAWKKWREGRMKREQAEEGLRKIQDCFHVVHPSTLLLPRALDLSIQLDHPAYDCFYLACAEATGGVLVTVDRALLAAARDGGLRHRVRHLADIPP